LIPFIFYRRLQPTDNLNGKISGASAPYHRVCGQLRNKKEEDASAIEPAVTVGQSLAPAS
jgi:hypothetical protein